MEFIDAEEAIQHLRSLERSCVDILQLRGKLDEFEQGMDGNCPKEIRDELSRIREKYS